MVLKIHSVTRTYPLPLVEITRTRNRAKTTLGKRINLELPQILISYLQSLAVRSKLYQNPTSSWLEESI